jgi:transcriptional regulator with XRE-family HTH domain
MPKSSQVALSLPPVARAALRELGENLGIARARRKESQRAWAERIGISMPTLIKLEKGDPTVSMGAYVSALWLMGRVQALPKIAAPEADLAALERDVRQLRRPRSVRKAMSVSEQLSKAGKSTPGRKGS